MNVTEERYCLRWTAYRGHAETSDHRCAECGERVIYNPTVGEGPVRLVCLDCLHAGSSNET